KHYTSNLVAVVTVSDDGGSSGRLSKELGVLPPGDVRNCMVAMADDESLLSALFRHRFQDGGLEGHSFGNLFLAALTEIAGDFELAVELSSQILATRGRVLPATLSKTVLCARHTDGSVTQGESAIPHRRVAIERVYLEPSDCDPPAQVLAEIQQADAIVLGPGSLFTSVIPNLLVNGVAEAVVRSPAPKIYTCNVMTQPGETDGFSAADHLDALLRHAGRPVVDYALVNLAFPQRLVDKYRAEGAHPVLADMVRIEKMGIEPIGANLISETDLVRHDSDRLARAIIDLIARHRSQEVEPGSAGAEFRRLRAVK
ncbi:MAG: gluconeogenesis factor YvcK family protein, partial [Candidatus Eremiobacterota bacterium]